MKKLAAITAILLVMLVTALKSAFAEDAFPGNIQVTLFNDLNKDSVQQSTEPFLEGMVDLESLTDKDAIFLAHSVYEDGIVNLTVQFGTYRVCVRPNDNAEWKVTGLNSLCQDTIVSNTNSSTSLLFGIQVPLQFHLFVPTVSR